MITLTAISIVTLTMTTADWNLSGFQFNNEHIINDVPYNNNYNEYIKIFWVGLMDGDGSIQVNHWRQQLLQYRLIIKLSNSKSNYDMLVKITKVIGGTVRITGKGEDVIWVVNKKKEVEEIITIFDTYPPLTSRKICQLAFLKTCLTESTVETYLLNRKLKYDNQFAIINSNIHFHIPTYFKGWLSGFIEAEGCFSIRKNNNHSFSIGQNNDIFLLNAIKEYFQATNKIRNPYSQFYSLEIYKKEVLLQIILHCTNYPLLGEKLESFKKFNKKFL
jgi:LAGLIDADG endonuclease